MVKVGIIGGSGLDNPGLLQDFKVKEVATPYGKVSAPLVIGKLDGVEVAILARHGKKHTINPTNVPYRANIHAMKEEGCTHIIATSACGSLRENIKPGDFVFVDQFIDRTTQRKSTFYDKGKVCHIPMAEPFCPKLRGILSETAKEMKLEFHKKGTVITIEGPRFSTKAESRMFRQWNADVINMSTVPEAVLAREAGICYAIVAMSTDYDCFMDDKLHVTIDEVLKVMKQNADNVKKLVLNVIPRVNYSDCKCKEDIKTSVIGRN